MTLEIIVWMGGPTEFDDTAERLRSLTEALHRLEDELGRFRQASADHRESLFRQTAQVHDHLQRACSRIHPADVGEPPPKRRSRRR